MNKIDSSKITIASPHFNRKRRRAKRDKIIERKREEEGGRKEIKIVFIV